jgi:hypothetical protein
MTLRAIAVRVILKITANFSSLTLSEIFVPAQLPHTTAAKPIQINDA